jgi:hypothetical protein
MGMSYEDLERALVRQGAANVAQREEIGRLRGLLNEALRSLNEDDYDDQKGVALELSIAAGDRTARKDEQEAPRAREG